MEEKKRLCRHCLSRDMNEKEYFANLHSYIERIDKDIKAEPGLYENRLCICMQCQWIKEEMCRSCGCFVKLRAAISKQTCPYDYW